MGMFPIENPSTIKLVYFLRMLDLDETKMLAIEEPKMIEMNEYINMCELNIFFGCDDENQRIKEFRDLTNKVDIKCLIIPWCDTMEHKGEKIKKAII